MLRLPWLAYACCSVAHVNGTVPPSSSNSAPSIGQVLLVGLYKENGTSVLSFTFNGSSSISALLASNIGAEPSWIIAANQGTDVGQFTSLLAVSESAGTVASLSLGCNGKITETSHANTGAGPVFLATDPSNDHALCANYGAGSISVLPLTWKQSHVTLEAASQTIEFGSNAHAHSAYFAPNQTCVGAEGCAVFVPTLGLDEVQQLRFQSGKLSKAHEPFTVPPHQGPRHMAFHPFLPVAVLTNEGSASTDVTVQLLGYDKEKGLTNVATYNASGPYDPLDLYPAEVLFTEQGDFVLVSVRDASEQKRDGVVVFKLGDGGRSLSFVDYALVGHYPRSMVLARTGMLIVGNQKGNSLSFLHLDLATGKLTKATEDLQINGSPAFVGIFRLADGCNLIKDSVLV